MVASFANAINDSSQVVGSVDYGGGIQHAFVWSRAEGMKDLGVLPGGKISAATAINASGQVAGYSSRASGPVHAFRWTRETGMVDLETLSGCAGSTPYGINNNGEVVGECALDPGLAVYRPFRWSESRGMEDLGTLDSDRGGGALAINDRGQIVGYSNPDSYYDESKAVLWTGVSTGVRIGTCVTGECYGQAKAINGNGDIVGTTSGSAFLRMQDGAFKDLGSLDPLNSAAVATGINDRGQIVGVDYSDLTTRGFIWTERKGMRALDGIRGKAEVMVSAINNKGEIVGNSR